MKKAHINTQQIAFNFDAAMATTSTVSATTQAPLLIAAMSHLADRLHNKIDMMRENDSFNAEVSLTIKQDDKDLMVAALDADISSLNAEQASVMKTVAQMASDADRKLFLSYDQVEQLFNAVRH